MTYILTDEEMQLYGRITNREFMLMLLSEADTTAAVLMKNDGTGENVFVYGT